MDSNVRATWTTALRSGLFPQGKGLLRNGKDEYCCLGVLCELAVQEGIMPPAELNEYDDDFVSDRYAYSEHENFLPAELRKRYDLHEGELQTLMNMNDTGFTFGEIADHIDANL